MHERTLKSRTVFTGRLLTLNVLDVELENKVRSTREVILHPGAAAVLARRGAGFVLVRQFRKPVESEVLEIVAGCLEKGERPEDCAVREVKEETGYKVASIVKLGVIWPAIGYSSEVLHLFCAELEDAGGQQEPDDDEHLQVVNVTEKELEGMISRNEIKDAKTVVAWQLWKAGRK